MRGFRIQEILPPSEATSSVCVWKGVSLESVLVLARVPYQLPDRSCLEAARQAGGLEVLTEATKNRCAR